MSYIKKGVFIFILLNLSFLRAQEHFTGYWQPQIALNYKLTDDYSHNFSVSQRNYIYKSETVRLEARQIDLAHFSTFKTSDNKSFGFGIQYRFRAIFEDEKQNELRLTQQFNVVHKWGNVRLGHRFRVEQRITSSLTMHRFRYRFALDTPLQGEKLDIGEPYLVGAIESLLSLARSNAPMYDQRITINLGWLLAKKTKLQTGLEYRFEDYTKNTENTLFVLSSLIFSL
ncbi:DUF2490 domain-containing protein [Spongiimicrobium sp. 3-5]|uniref:DUF2490 domain-containing protein n=1 Tax=Spongiimicrobium sp. 3-5 TaxID=3332596 RepID=UPI0039807C46